MENTEKTPTIVHEDHEDEDPQEDDDVLDASSLSLHELVDESINLGLKEAVRRQSGIFQPPNKSLTENMMEISLSELGWTADGSGQAMLKCDLSNMDLTNIEMIIFYKYLQSLDLSGNFLSSINSCLSMVDLLQANFANNNLQEIDLANSPELRFLDVCHNQISSLLTMKNHPRLRMLRANSNFINTVEGLDLCQSLQSLHLSNNQLDTLEHFSALPSLTYLNVEHNNLESLKGVENLKSLTYLNAGHNSISTLSELSGLDNLQELLLSSTKLESLDEIDCLSKIQFLTCLDVSNTPLQGQPMHRLNMFHKLPSLVFLNNKKASVTEKVAAVNMCSPQPSVVVSRDHSKQLSRRLFANNVIGFSTLSTPNMSYPLLVFVGDDWQKLHTQADAIVQQNTACERILLLTTMSPAPPGTKNISTEDFEALVDDGEFFFTFSDNGNSFGLKLDSVDQVASLGHIPVLTMLENYTSSLALPGISIFRVKVPEDNSCDATDIPKANTAFDVIYDSDKLNAWLNKQQKELSADGSVQFRRVIFAYEAKKNQSS